MTNKTKKEKQNASSQGVFDWAWNGLKSMRFAIIILMVIAVASIVNLFAGEFIIQAEGTTQQIRATYQQAYPDMRTDLLMFFQMYAPYSSWWFTSLMGLLLLSLIICVIDRAPIVWKEVSHHQFLRDEESFRSAKLHTEIGKGISKDSLLAALKAHHFKVGIEEVGDKVLIAGAKNTFSYIGPWLVHIGFILLTIGGAMIARGEFRMHASALPGELLSVGRTPLDLGFNVRVDDFQIEYYPLNVNQYVELSNGSIGRIVKKHKNNSFDVELFSPASGFRNDVPADQLSNRIDRRMGGGRLDQANISDYIATVTVLENGQDVKTEVVEVNHPLRHRGFRFYQSSFNDRITDNQGRWMTVMQVRRDTGSPLVWVGILVFSVGLIMGMYFTPKRVFALLDGDKMLLAGRSKQNMTLFEEEFNSLIKRIQSIKKS
ncbi:cytochrome c biogenesis protein ResB [bacterium]|nr:cytochrome c biogenesis protein ResB [bacterium]